jgi:DNA transformation protein and related proteins
VPHDSFKDFVIEQLDAVDDLDCRAMFGGFGLYRGGDFFGIVYDGRLYFRTDAATRPQYEAAGSEAFRPNPRQTLKSYYEVPAEVVEERARLAEWAERAVAADRR